MSKLFLFDAGSTKTNVLIVRDITKKHVIEEQKLPGINPNRLDRSFFEDLKKRIKIEESDKVFFYGSGLGNESNKELISNQFEHIYNNIPTVNDDILGAARSCLSHQSGLFGIMGTGACMAFYNGKKVLERNGGYGYLIDDIGGGLELGKLIVSQWLNGSLSNELANEVEINLNVSKIDFIKKFYSSPQLIELSELVKLLPKYFEDDQLNEMLENYFDLFFKRHVSPLAEKLNEKSISLVGSIAYNFKKQIENVAIQHGLQVKKVIQYPIKDLLKFHLLE